MTSIAGAFSKRFSATKREKVGVSSIPSRM